MPRMAGHQRQIDPDLLRGRLPTLRDRRIENDLFGSRRIQPGIISLLVFK